MQKMNPRKIDHPHISLCDVPDVIYIFDLAFMLNGAHGDGLGTDFGGNVLFYFDTQVFEHQVPCGGSNRNVRPRGQVQSREPHG